ncbi:MAG TPA: ABC transporter permease [Burkholderiaceae bacterium]|nr:ABC transporter permease [Burkholderiaceae bacterium]
MTAAARDSFIRLAGITKTYGDGQAAFQALKGIDLDIAEGEFVAIMGPSGSGKSTAMNILGCLDTPSSGTYEFRGVHVERLSRRQRALLRRHVLGFVFQGFNLLARTSALENVELPLIYRGEAASARHAAAHAALEQVGLAGWDEHTPAELSGGQQQRVAIARAIVTRPAVLLADEPTGNLDTKTSREIMDLITTLNREHGITVLMVTHEPDMAAYAKRAVRFVDGRVESDRRNGGERLMLWNALVLALRAIRRNVMRSFLTTLGVVIGVAAVITMVTLGNGATRSVTDQIASMGSDLLIIVPGQGFGLGAGAAPNFKLADADAIRSQIGTVDVVAPVATKPVTAVYQAKNWNTVITGSTNDFFGAGNWVLVSGRTFSEAEERAGKAVCVIGETVRSNLFGHGSPIGAEMRIKQFACEVVGLLKAKGQSAMGQDQDDTIVMPLRTVQRRLTGSQDITRLTVTVRDGASADTAKSQLTSLMRQRRNISETEDDNFRVMDTRQIAEMLTGTTRILTMLLGAVAAVSLLVGGIGIMNIMLVSVTERTREIGIRLAIGALEGEVLLQFLIEAVVLASLGGVAGLALAAAGSAALASAMSIPYVFDSTINVLSFMFSAAIGVVFGYFPARRAARLDPIEALRHE